MDTIKWRWNKYITLFFFLKLFMASIWMSSSRASPSSQVLFCFSSLITRFKLTSQYQSPLKPTLRWGRIGLGSHRTFTEEDAVSILPPSKHEVGTVLMPFHRKLYLSKQQNGKILALISHHSIASNFYFIEYQELRAT